MVGILALAGAFGCHHALGPRPTAPVTLVGVESSSPIPIEAEIARNEPAPPEPVRDGAFEDALYFLETGASDELVDGELRRADPRELVSRLRDGLRRSTDDPDLESVIHWCAAPYDLAKTPVQRKVVTEVCDRVATKAFTWMGAAGADHRARERAVGVDVAVILERNPKRAHTAKAWRKRMDQVIQLRRAAAVR
jgi:hypothetical protein